MLITQSPVSRLISKFIVDGLSFGNTASVRTAKNGSRGSRETTVGTFSLLYYSQIRIWEVWIEQIWSWKQSPCKLKLRSWYFDWGYHGLLHQVYPSKTTMDLLSGGVFCDHCKSQRRWLVIVELPERRWLVMCLCGTRFGSLWQPPIVKCTYILAVCQAVILARHYLVLRLSCLFGSYFSRRSYRIIHLMRHQWQALCSFF